VQAADHVQQNGENWTALFIMRRPAYRPSRSSLNAARSYMAGECRCSISLKLLPIMPVGARIAISSKDA
jgi:hypothetical protein